MSVSLLTDIGSHVNPVGSVWPQAISGSSDVNGANTFDRVGTTTNEHYLSGVLVLNVGATTGTPTTFSVACRLQDSADNSSFADIATAVAVTAVTTANTTATVAFNAKGLRRYLRAVVTPTFSGGTSPTVLVSASLVMGGAAVVPAT